MVVPELNWLLPLPVPDGISVQLVPSALEYAIWPAPPTATNLVPSHAMPEILLSKEPNLVSVTAVHVGPEPGMDGVVTVTVAVFFLVLSNTEVA